MCFRDAALLLTTVGGLYCFPAFASAAESTTVHGATVKVVSQADNVKVIVGGGFTSFATGSSLAAAFQTALRRYIQTADVTIVSAEVQSADSPSDRDTFILNVLSAREAFQLRAGSPHDYATIEHDFRRDLPSYLEVCARQLAYALEIKRHKNR